MTSTTGASGEPEVRLMKHEMYVGKPSKRVGELRHMLGKSTKVETRRVSTFDVNYPRRNEAAMREKNWPLPLTKLSA